MNVVLLGPPGSGKGTQGHIFAEYFNLKHFSTGDLFRDILKNPGHPLYHEVKIIREGNLVPDRVVNSMIQETILNNTYKNGILFDGFPRTVGQAIKLNEFLSSIGKSLDFIIDFIVTEEVLKSRLLGRRVCPQCKAVFHIKQGYGKCPECNFTLVRREDDNAETIIKRLKEYEDKTKPLQEFYKNGQIPYIPIKINDTEKTPKDIQDNIMQELLKRGII